MKKLLTFLMFFLLATAMAQMQAATKTVTYTVESTSSVKVSGTPPSTTATDPAYSSTYTAAKQLTGGNSMQLTLYGFSGKKITGITLSMRSNSSAGAGYFSMKAGSTTLASIGSTSSGVKFNDAKWNGSWSTSYTDVTPQMTNNSYVIQQAENVVILIGATANSLYCQSFTIAYEEGGSAPSYNVNVASGIVGGTVTASPTSAKEGDEVTLTATPASGYEFGSWNVTNASTSATITVTNNKFKMPAANVNVSATFNKVTPGPTPSGDGYDFTFITHPSGWPIAKESAAAGTYTYNLNGKSYSFTHTKEGAGIYLAGTSGTSGYLLLSADNMLGLPAIEGYKLVKVVGQLNNQGTPSTSSRVSITDGTNTVTGGDSQTWSEKGGNYTYSLSGTTANTVYYLTVSNKNCQMINLSLTYEKEGDTPTPSGPSIEAESALNLTAAEGDGTFNVTWTNAAEMGVKLYTDEGCTTTFTGSWFQTQLNKSDNNVYYIVAPNTELTPRTVYMRLYALGEDGESEATKVVTVTQEAAPVTKYAITIAETTNGSVTASVAEAAADEVVTLTVTPAEHYSLKSLTVTGASGDVNVTDGKFTMPAEAVTVNATFVENQKYTITWSVNGEVAKTENLYAGDAVSAPTVNPIDEKVFTGWVTTSTVAANQTPAYVTPGAVTADATYYAVFATKSGSAQTTEITYNSTGIPTSYGNNKEVTVNGTTFNVTQMYKNGEKMQWRAAGNSSGTGAMYNKTAINNIQSIAITYTNDDNNKNFTVKVGNSANPTSGTEITATRDGETNTYVYDCSSTSPSYFVLTNGSGAGYLSSIVITYIGGEVSYSDFTTIVKTTPSVAAPVVTPESGKYRPKDFKVEATCATTGAEIYYTLGDDGEATKYTEALDGQTGTYTFWATLDVDGETITSEEVVSEYQVAVLDHIEVTGIKRNWYTDETFAFTGINAKAYFEDNLIPEVSITSDVVRPVVDITTEGEQNLTFSYTEGGVTKTYDYKITVKVRGERTVTVVAPVNGAITVEVTKHGTSGKTVIPSGETVWDGDKIEVTLTPADGYELVKWSINGTNRTSTTYTVNGSDIEIAAVFGLPQKYTYTWCVYGQDDQNYVLDPGATVTAPDVTTVTGPEGKKFVGWSRTATVKEDNFTPAVLDETAVTDRTYFAVFATVTGSGDGSDYYEKVPSTYTDWLNGEYLIVNEYNSSTYARVFNGLPSSGTQNVCTTNARILSENGKLVIKEIPENAAKITFEVSNEHLRARINGEDKFIVTPDGGGNGLNVLTDAEIKDNSKRSVQVAMLDIEYHVQEPTGHWDAKLNGNYLSYNTSSGFRAYTSEQTLKVDFYVKKAGTPASYSDYTTGMTVDPHQFQLVTDLDTLNKVGREYIIVTKYRNEAGSRTIYGLSVDNADSRTENGKEGTSKTTTNFRRGETGVTFSHGDYFASIDNKISVLTLGGSEGAWTFNSAAGYLVKGGNPTETFLRINSASANATIAKDNLDVATIKFANATEREVFLNINGGYPRYGAYAHNNLTDTDKKFNYAASYLYWREALNEESLAEIEANGISGTEYTVTDELDVVYVQDNFAWAKDWAKDAHGSSYAYRTNEPEYEATWYPVGNSFDTNNYDQSNWIKLVFADSQSGLEAANAIKGKRLNGSAVTGVYTGHKDRFHEIEVNTDLSVNIQGDAPEYTPNVYTMASFWDENIYDYAVAQNDRKFFFMNPKIEEYCIVTEAMWDGSKFVVPSGTTTDGVKLNEAGFDGGFTVDWKLSVDDDQIGDLEAALNASPSNRYTFEAIIVKTEPSLTPKEDGPAKAATAKDVTLGSTHFVAYPIGFNAPGDHIVTDVKDVNVAGREVKSVRYYDVAGRSYGEAQPGINIVVTEYTDGSHSAAKMVR